MSKNKPKRKTNKYSHQLIKDFDLLAAFWRFPFEHVAVVRFGRRGKLGERRTAQIVWKYNNKKMKPVLCFFFLENDNETNAWNVHYTCWLQILRSCRKRRSSASSVQSVCGIIVSLLFLWTPKEDKLSKLIMEFFGNRLRLENKQDW